MLKPANVIHLRIEEDLIYTRVYQAFGFDQSHSCTCVAKASLAGDNRTVVMSVHHTMVTQNFSMQMAAARAFANFKQLLL